MHPKLIKENQNQSLKKALQRGQNQEDKNLIQLRKKKETINNELFSYYFDYLNPVIMFEGLRDASDEKIKVWQNQLTKN